MRYVYLHGFASSPASRKAQAFAKAFQEHAQNGSRPRRCGRRVPWLLAARDSALCAFESPGIELEIPALDGGDFEHLTISGQLAIIERLLHGDTACLIGSSMGGYLAALYAARHPEIERLVLLAPAFNFVDRWAARADGDGQWSATGRLEVFHYGEKRQRKLHYGLIEDARQYAPAPDFRQPCLIAHGRNDDTVPVTESRNFVASHPNAALRELDSDHELLDVLETVITEAMAFLLFVKSDHGKMTMGT